MTNDADTKNVHLRNEFYRDNYRRVMMALLLSMLLNIALGAGIFFLYNKQPGTVYFSTNVDGTLLKMIPLNQPYLNSEQLMSWAIQATLAVYSYDFKSYEKQLQNAQQYFTEAGFENYRESLERSGNIQTIIDKKMVVSAVVADTPVILDEDNIGGRYAWKVQIPLIVHYVGSIEKSEPILVTLLIGRVSTLESTKGVAIAKFDSVLRKEPDFRR